jgi:phosphosulfolactate synthase (CoM biosynthesis protein A)
VIELSTDFITCRFERYVKNYGNKINLFVDDNLIVQLEALRASIWGTKSTWSPVHNLDG